MNERGKIMSDRPKSEDEIIKEVYRLCNDVIYLATHDPSQEDISKHREQMVKDIEEGIVRN